jgi:hypothetical protein
MSRPVSSSNTVSINWDQAPNQNDLNEVNAFKKSLGPNDRVLVNSSGNTTIYTQHRESVSEKIARKLDNFEKHVKSAWSHVGDLFSVKNKGNGPEATKNIKDTPTQKSPPPKSSSISVKQFNLQISPITNTFIIPKFVGLQNDHTKAGLSAPKTEVNEVENLDRALDFFATGPHSLDKVKNEFSAFLAFAEAQAGGETFADQNGDAINFAKRWMPVSIHSKDELIGLFGQKAYGTITAAAVQLALFYED